MAFAGQYSGPGVVLSFKASAAIHRGAAVRLDTADGYVITNDSDGGLCLGIAVEAATAADQSIGVCVLGVCQATADTTVTKGVALQANTDGHVYAATTADLVLGYALEAAAADGDDITILVCPAGIY